MRLRLDQLEAVFWIARLGSFRAAAERLNLTQPTVSMRIRELEEQVGGPLFDRNSYRARLSAISSLNSSSMCARTSVLRVRSIDWSTSERSRFCTRVFKST